MEVWMDGWMEGMNLREGGNGWMKGIEELDGGYGWMNGRDEWEGGMDEWRGYGYGDVLEWVRGVLGWGFKFSIVVILIEFYILFFW